MPLKAAESNPIFSEPPPVDPFDPGMAVDLLSLNEGYATPSGLEIKKVTDQKEAKILIDVEVSGFGMPDFVGDAYKSYMEEMDKDIKCWLLGGVFAVVGY